MVSPIYSGIEERLSSLERKVSFEDNELFKHYLRMHHHLQKEFPEEEVRFSGFSYEGPITSAVLLRGQDFYLDLYDHPEKVRAFIQAAKNVESHP